jgi:hypothetical protein
MREQIEERIREYLADPDSRLRWMREAARRYNFVPLYVGWVATLGIQPDGALSNGDTRTIPAGCIRSPIRTGNGWRCPKAHDDIPSWLR